MKKMISSLFSAALLVAASLQTHAQGFVYDQQSATGPISPFNSGVDGLYIQEDSPLIQSFIPTFSTIGFVQLEFQDPPNNGSSGATVYVNLWTGSPNINSATLLGSTTPVYMPNGFVNNNLGLAGVTNFYFSTSITLTPSQNYYLQPVVLSGDDPWAIETFTYDAYPNGQLFARGGAIQPTSDMWFREGIASSVPEPSALALVGLSSLLVFLFNRRSKLPVLFLAGVLFAAPVLHVYSAPDSVVQVTADEAGLTQVSASALPRTGTFWVMTAESNGRLMALPYPALPPNLSALPIYSVTDNAFIIDDTGGQLLPSSTERISSAQATSTAQTQAATMAALIERILYSTNNGEVNS